MLRLFPEQADDLLDVDSLPPTDGTELNYRTRPLTAEQELRLTALLLLGTVPVVVLLSVPMYCLTSLHPWIDDMVFVAGPVVIVWLCFRRLIGAIVRWEVVLGVLFFVCSTGGLLWDWAQRAEVWTWRFAMVVAWVTSSLIARQAAAWILAAPTVDHDTTLRWRVNLPGIIPRGLSLDCPDLLTYHASPLLIGGSWWLATQLANELRGGIWTWPVTFLLSIHLVWFGWHVVATPFVPWPDLPRSWKLTWQALVVVATYDVYRTPAAGVFRFPTRWLRCPWHRWGLLLFTLLAIAFGYGTCCPGPLETLVEQGALVGPVLANYLLMAVAGPLVLCGVLWLTAGTLLARFDTELSRHKDEETTDWDNYIDRIINSNDELEREHLFLGTSESGDYPILVHQEIYDQHCHILGDSGASKTALGIAPQVTQMIARGDSTIVVVDLKGDKALFETCRREAARTKKLRFRWLSNEVGHTTYGFNPFLQLHNSRLSVEQLTQELLQGLSLDYGIEYGAGYFTAMNEIVLNNVLRETGAKSFRELDKRLADPEWYASIGQKEDWKQARHLGALVKRLAASDTVNLAPDMYPDQPEVHEQAIDATNLLEEPQVVYLWLRSAVEPTNAPAIARLFLWTMFTAASHQPQDKNRVYFFVDEMQQIISDGIKLIFEQFRDLGGTMIAAHQTAGQLHRHGTDLGDTIDSCTAVKQVFRASDPRSLERLGKLSGTRLEQAATWYQRYERGTGELMERYDPLLARDGLVRVSEQMRARYDWDELLAIGSRQLSSLVRFTFASGYTQFAGATVPMVSQYHITFDQYRRRRQEPWPAAPGAFAIRPPAGPPASKDGSPTSASTSAETETEAGAGTGTESGFPGEFRRRAKSRKR